MNKVRVGHIVPTDINTDAKVTDVFKDGSVYVAFEQWDGHAVGYHMHMNAEGLYSPVEGGDYGKKLSKYRKNDTGLPKQRSDY